MHMGRTCSIALGAKDTLQVQRRRAHIPQHLLDTQIWGESKHHRQNHCTKHWTLDISVSTRKKAQPWNEFPTFQKSNGCQPLPLNLNSCSDCTWCSWTVNTLRLSVYFYWKWCINTVIFVYINVQKISSAMGPTNYRGQIWSNHVTSTNYVDVNTQQPIPMTAHQAACSRWNFSSWTTSRLDAWLSWDNNEIWCSTTDSTACDFNVLVPW